jgi:hypothetical protein
VVFETASLSIPGEPSLETLNPVIDAHEEYAVAESYLSGDPLSIA